MVQLHIVPFDLRRQLPTTKAPTGSVVEPISKVAPTRESQNLSFGELQILLEGRKPIGMAPVQEQGYQASGARAHKQLIEQESYHYERLNRDKSVLGSVSHEEVHLSAQSMVG